MKDTEYKFKEFYIDHFTYKGEVNMSIFHQHQYYEMIYIVTGQRQFLFYNEKYILSNKNIALIPPNLLHKSKSFQSLSQERVYVYFKREFVERYIPTAQNLLLDSLTKPIILTEEESKHIIPMIMNLTELYHGKPDMLKHISLELNFLSVLVEFTRQVLKRPQTELSTKKDDKLYMDMMNYINKNFQNKITLDNLSEMFGLSKYRISKKLNSRLGTSWVTHINMLRVSEAQKMLPQSQSNILDIALSLGFGNLTHFERVFKEITGYSPTQYTNIIKNQNEMPEGK